METLIKGILAQTTLQDNFKITAITNLLKKTASLSKPDASVLLDLGLELKSTARSLLEDKVGDRILLAVSTAHRDLFWARLANDWLESQLSDTNLDYVRKIPLMIAVVKRKEGSALNEEHKQMVIQDMETLQSFSEKRCISANPPLKHSIQCIFVSMFVALPATRPSAMSNYIEFLVDHLANMPTSQDGVPLSKSAIYLLQQCWENGPDNIFITISQLFSNLSDDQRECSIGVGHLLQAVPETCTSGAWIVAIIESLALRGEFSMLKELADQNAYKIARQLPFKQRRDDALLVLKPMLLGYHHSPVLFNNISKGLLPLLGSCRKTPDDKAFAAEVCSLAQTLVIHFGDADGIGIKVQKARTILDLVSCPKQLRIQAAYEFVKPTALPDWLNDGHQQDAAEFTK
ncbi:hypothetical protein BGX27_009882 [Mortierella sp. AM989]|nr:hypothetical protein BGX27_009882 [Mortierella sp. AM989]